MLIGLTGTKASGKGILADILKEKGFIYLSLSDAVREEAVKRGIVDYTIKQLQDIGNELREKYGNGVLARKIMEKFENGKNYVIDGIRNVGEIEEFRKANEKFVLIAVDAPQAVRFKRLLKRGRESDPKTWQDFLEMDKRDRGFSEGKSGQQVEKCMELADIKIYNDFNVEVLKEEIKKILRKLKC